MISGKLRMFLIILGIYLKNVTWEISVPTVLKLKYQENFDTRLYPDYRVNDVTKLLSPLQVKLPASSAVLVLIYIQLLFFIFSYLTVYVYCNLLPHARCVNLSYI